jgi:hypothetical protein
MRVQTHTPDLGNHPVTELVESEPIKAVGAKELPKDASSTKSQPATSHEDASKSSALEQGKSFEETIPKSNANPVVVERVIEKVVRVPRKCPKQECPKQECPKQKCPKQECPSPVCPDMRDYIRKDSIPCWACKLN